MEKGILLNRYLPVKKKIKNFFFYVSRKRGAQKSWTNRHQKVLKANSSYRKPISKNIELEHKKLWMDFRKNPDLTTLRICSNISGVADSRIVPEDIFVSDIEPTLLKDSSANFLSHKSFYNKWFPKGLFPEDIVHCIEGRFYCKNLKEIDFSEFVRIADTQEYPLVLKPNKDSYGGNGIHFVKNSEELISLGKTGSDFVVQEQISQHPFFGKFNPIGLNTIRVYLYRSVKDEQLHILNMAFRMGKNGSLDNETAGGIHTMIHPDGTLNGYAVDKFGVKYYEHPDTGHTFTSKIPAIDELKNLAKEVASKVFFARIIGLDVCLDDKGEWRVIEINLTGCTIRFAQYGGQPFFGKFTNEVINYCTQNHWTFTNE